MRIPKITYVPFEQVEEETGGISGPDDGWHYFKVGRRRAVYRCSLHGAPVDRLRGDFAVYARKDDAWGASRNMVNDPKHALPRHLWPVMKSLIRLVGQND